ncbi:toxin-antitoxin system YwqK family antitoxin [Reichenbachiella ulvae]|uniref:MORN repeat variant n=1 Tax=Reichenbachiella ulvae TaxID=2980104 RepID=A0ABT3CW47_9BACT|nr:hypothetical protein [Reichenbachiella ulvae]MCV9387463.1 hypothetical protein [Reichenbachiella ulvae]
MSKMTFSVLLLGMGWMLIQSCKTKQVQPTEDFSFKHYQSITLDHGDSLVKFHISENPEDIETDFSKDYYWFKVDRIGHSQGQYTGKLLDGSYEVIDQKDKSLMRKGEFTEGLQSGQWIEWYPGGEVIRAAYEYAEGEKEGSFLKQNPTGSPLMKGSYSKDQLNGKVDYYQSDTLQWTIRYRMGVPQDTIQ